MNKRGIVLVASIMLIVFVSIAVLGITVFITQRLTYADAQRTSAENIYSAQAGIQKALYDFRFRDLSGEGYITLGQTNIDAGNYFVICATAADLLMTNISGTFIQNNKKFLENFLLRNATNSQTITIDRIIVTWNVGTVRITDIRLNNGFVWSGNLTSPATCDISNFTLASNQTIYSNNQIRFNGDVSTATISVRFIMTDGSTRDVNMFPASNNNNFIVNATGKRTASGMFQTARAEYNPLTGRVLDYEETDTQFTP